MYADSHPAYPERRGRAVMVTPDAKRGQQPLTDLFGVEATAGNFGAHMDMGRPGSGAHDEWLTPPDLVAAVGPFDLDPCSPIKRPWPTAELHYTVADDGLRQPWDGLVWCNPPYAEWGRWLHRLADHGDGIALIFARTETRDFFGAVWERADSVLFLKGRIRFYRPNGKQGATSGGAPSVLIAYGPRAVERLADSGLAGRLVHLKELSLPPHGRPSERFTEAEGQHFLNPNMDMQ